MQSYTITEIKSYSSETYGKDNQHRTVFKVEGNDDWLSAFVANPLVPGSTITGDIVSKEKDGKTYHNFNFPRSGTQAPQNAQNPDKFTITNQEIKNLITLKVIPEFKEVIDGQNRIIARQDRLEKMLEKAVGLDPAAIDTAFDQAF